MKKYTQISVATLLSLVLISSTYAGQILIQNKTGKQVQLRFTDIKAFGASRTIGIPNNKTLSLGSKFKETSIGSRALRKNRQTIEVDWEKVIKEQKHQAISLTPDRAKIKTITNKRLQKMKDDADAGLNLITE